MEREVQNCAVIKLSVRHFVCKNMFPFTKEKSMSRSTFWWCYYTRWRNWYLLYTFMYELSLSSHLSLNVWDGRSVYDICSNYIIHCYFSILYQTIPNISFERSYAWKIKYFLVFSWFIPSLDFFYGEKIFIGLYCLYDRLNG